MTRIFFACLICVVAGYALAGEPGKDLRLNDISAVLREAEGQAKNLPPLANDQTAAGESAAGKLMELFNATSYQARIRDEQQRLRQTLAKDAMREYMPSPDTPSSTYSKLHSDQDREGKRAATRQYREYGEEPHSAADKGIGLKATWNQVDPNTERLYLFISSSVPMPTLRAYAAMIDQAKASQVTMVLRGFVGGMKKAGPTLAFIGEIVKQDPACDLGKGKCDSYQVNIQIDPERFQQFRIEEVPALVYLAAGDDDKTPGAPLIVSGDASLDALLERINREVKSPSLQTMIAALRHGNDKGECQ